MKKKIIIPAALVLAIITLAAYRTALVYAQGSDNKYPPVLEKLVERFDLNEDEVKVVFDEVREEHQGQMQENFQERLDQAVEEGKITAEQKDLIFAKHEELRAEKEAINWYEFSPEEKKEKGQEMHEELEAWAESNGIDLPLFFGLGKGEGRNKFGGRGRGFHKEI